MKNILIGLLTAFAFAGNSILARAALADGAIDPMSFSFIRVISAASFLAIVLLVINRAAFTFKGHMGASLSLAIYVVFFSLAYQYLTGATGALILFAVVQFTLVGYSYLRGVPLARLEWLGLIAAFSGVVLLLLPGVEQPSYIGFGLMFVSGLGWAGFTIVGLRHNSAVVDVTLSFIKATPVVMVLWLVVRVEPNVTTLGLTLAVVSGIVTSGLGYFLWFLLLPSLSSSSAAAFQLSVPVVVAFLGIVFLDELLSLQVILASAIVLSGLGLFTYAKLRKNSESYAP